MTITWREVVVAIPTVQPQRAGLLSTLLGQVCHACHGVIVLVHPHVHGDSPRWDFPRMMTAAARVGRPWILQLEDDAYLAPTFGTAALECGFDVADCVSLFSRRKADMEAYRAGQALNKRAPRAFCGNVGFFLKAEFAEGLEPFAVDYFAKHAEHVHAADYLFAEHLAALGARVVIRLPSLVQHAGKASTLPHRHGARQSAMYRLAFGDIPT